MDKRTASRIRRTNGVSRFQNGISTTLAGLTCNISVVDGTAFVTNPSVDLTPYLGCRITLVDTARLSLIGWVKAKGTGESLGTNIVTGGDFESGLVGGKGDGGGSVSTWTLNTTSPIAGTKDGLLDVTTAGPGRPTLSWPGTAVLGKLYKHSIKHKHNSGARAKFEINDGSNAAAYSSGFFSDSATKSGYLTCRGVSNFGIMYMYSEGSLPLNVQFDDVERIPVLTPSATGVTITNSPGGSVFNWAAKHPSFNPNSATFNAIIRA